MLYEIEEKLFNHTFNEPILYIFQKDKINPHLLLIRYDNYNTIKIIKSFSNLADLIDFGNDYAKNNGWHFINNTIFCRSTIYNF